MQIRPLCFIKTLLANVLCFAAVTSVFAAVPGSFTYQGSLKNNGVPVNSTTAIEIRITNDTGSITYWASGAQSVPVLEGLYRMELTPTNVDWANVTPYIETRVNGTLLLPREKLTGTAYALLAKDLAAGATASYALVAKDLAAGAVAKGNLFIKEGSLSAPGIAFFNDQDTGFYQSAGDRLSVVVGGGEIARFFPSTFAVKDGTVGDPGFSFLNEPGTGIRRYGTQDTRFVAGGKDLLMISPNDIRFMGNGVDKLQWNGSHLLPMPDNAVKLGLPDHRFAELWAANGTIQSSASNLKRDIKELVPSASGLSLVSIASVDPKLRPTPLPVASADAVTIPRGIMFKWKSKQGQADDKDVIGFMGDDLPEEAHAIRADGTRDPENFYTSSVIGVMLAKIRGQDAVIKDLTQRLAQLENKSK